MSKKKSYMNVKNILSEDVITSFLKGLFRGITRQKPRTLRKIKSDLNKKINKFNDNRQSMHDYINKIRVKNGQKPAPSPKKLTMKQVIDDLEAGKK